MNPLRQSILLILLIFLTACSPDEEQSKQQDEQGENNDNVEVDKGLLNVEVTLPTELFEGQDIENVIKEAEESGVKEVTQNEDGSLTYKMSKKQHQEMLKELEESLAKSVDEIIGGEDYPAVVDITYDDTFAEFVVEVEKEQFDNSFNSFTVPFNLGFSGMYYQLFSGVDPDKYHVLIKLKDTSTEEIYNEIIFPDSVENAGDDNTKEDNSEE